MDLGETGDLEKLMQDLELTDSPPTNLAECSIMLKRLTEVTRSDNFRCEIPLSHWQTLIKVVKYWVNVLQIKSPLDNEMDFLTDVLRFLRNLSARCRCDDQIIESLKEVLVACLGVLNALLKHRTKQTERETVALRICLQVLGNLVCQSTVLKEVVTSSFKDKNTFSLLLQNKDLKVQEFTMMILYNCLTGEFREYLVCTKEGHEIIYLLTHTLNQCIIEWGFFTMEFLVNSEQFMEKCYPHLPIKNRAMFLDVLEMQLDKMESYRCVIPESNLRLIKDYFMSYVNEILKMSESHVDYMKASEIVKILSLLCLASISRKTSEIMKGYMDLLEFCVEMLKSVHFLGRHSKNNFSVVGGLREIDDNLKKQIEINPTFGFKKSLLRYIANVCEDCKENQDKVREMDGIPLIMDCCDIDVRNPYIQQWAVLAISNLMKNNPENQAVLASITITGVMEDSPLLKELGLFVEMQDGKPVLKNVKRNSDVQ